MSTGESSCQQENVSCRQGCVLYRSGFTLCTGWGLVDRNFGLVDLVNKALGLVNKPKWHFEMACMLLMSSGTNGHVTGAFYGVDNRFTGLVRTE